MQQEYSVSTMRRRCAQAKTAQLQQGMKYLDDRIRAEVELRQSDLMQQAENLREAQTFMQARCPFTNQQDQASSGVPLNFTGTRGAAIEASGRHNTLSAAPCNHRA